MDENIHHAQLFVRLFAIIFNGEDFACNSFKYVAER